MAPKQQAPPPPTRGFTGFVPSPTPRDKFSAWRQRRQQAKASRPRAPMIQINTGPAQSTSRRRRRGGPTGHTYSRRRRPKRGTLFAMLTVVVATVAVTATVIEFTAWETASELFTLAECISFGTAWFFGEPPAPKPAVAPKAANVVKNKRPRQPAAQQGSGGHKCGAPTQDGSGCQRPVKNPADNCWEHPGGKGNPKAKTTAKPAGPKRTKKAAPPPASPPPTPAPSP